MAGKNPRDIQNNTSSDSLGRVHKFVEKITLMKLNEAYQKVVYWYFSFPDHASSLNDLSTNLKISKTTAKGVVEDLIKQGFLIRKIYGKTWIISCNREHIFNKTRKVVFNLDMVFAAYASGLRDNIMQQVGNARSVILFGSYRRGDDTELSDLDIAVEVMDNEPMRIVEIGMIPLFGFRKNVKINLHIFCRNMIDVNLFTNISNGIVLEGFLEVRP